MSSTTTAWAVERSYGKFSSWMKQRFGHLNNFPLFLISSSLSPYHFSYILIASSLSVSLYFPIWFSFPFSPSKRWPLSPSHLCKLSLSYVKSTHIGIWSSHFFRSQAVVSFCRNGEYEEGGDVGMAQSNQISQGFWLL